MFGFGFEFFMKRRTDKSDDSDGNMIKRNLRFVLYWLIIILFRVVRMVSSGRDIRDIGYYTIIMIIGGVIFLSILDFFIKRKSDKSEDSVLY